jgi:hypothetical protein
MTIKVDNRPGKGFYIPGEFVKSCRFCNGYYSGDQRSTSCADCAYPPSVWQTIESAPRDGKRILLFADGAIHVGSFYNNVWTAQWVIYMEPEGEKMAKLKPTHWMPLPPAPLV